MKSLKKVSQSIHYAYKNDVETFWQYLALIYKIIVCYCIVFPLMFVLAIIIGILMIGNPLNIFDELVNSLF